MSWDRFVTSLAMPAKPRHAPPVRLVCFDMDGVLVQQESSWVAVHDHFGVHNESGLQSFLRGEIDDMEFIRRDVELWKERQPGITIGDIESILRTRIQLMPGAAETIERLRQEGIECAIVSAGLEPAARNVAHRLGIHHVSSNGLEVDAHGRLTGRGILGTPLRDKSVPLERFANQLGIRLGSVAAVGNSSPDIAMFRRCGLGLAFRPTDTPTRQHADRVIEGPSLDAILPHLLP